MRPITSLSVAALMLAVAVPASAQTASGAPSEVAPTQAAPTQAGPPADAAPPAGATAAPIVVGQTVKDNTGATIGKVSQVKPDASGKQTAVIAMGAQSFAVDTSALVVQNGSAVINASRSELQGMIGKSTSTK
jgi:hypothetical protein